MSGDDMRDGFVYFGCKKSVKLNNNSNLDNESTTIVSKRKVNILETNCERLCNSEQERGNIRVTQGASLPDIV